MDRFGLSDKSNWPAGVLAYGDKKRVELARATVGRPDLLLLDEPVAGLNGEETAAVGEQLKLLRRAGHTILLVEHDMDLVMNIADQVVVLDSGKCIATGTPGRSAAKPSGAGSLSRPHGGNRLMLTINNLSAHYGAAQALFGINMAIAAGETVALVGANGAGKSTLLKCLLGLHKPTTGTILLDGEDVTKASPAKMVRLGVTLSPEGREVFSNLSVFENLQLGAIPLNLTKNEETRRMAEVYERFPKLLARTDQLAGTLSGGEQQMLAMGRALMAKPRLLLLDEPSLGPGTAHYGRYLCHNTPTCPWRNNYPAGGTKRRARSVCF